MHGFSMIYCCDNVRVTKEKERNLFYLMFVALNFEKSSIIGLKVGCSKANMTLILTDGLTDRGTWTKLQIY